MPPQTRRVLRFIEPKRVSVDTEPLTPPSEDEVTVETVFSAVSPGTETLVYRGEIPSGRTGDSAVDSLSEGLEFPLRYGYACVGRISAVGMALSDEWLDRRVFAFRPHVSHFTATPDELIPLPEEVSWMEGVLIPNTETAVNLVMDTAPVLGENIVVFGQGVVGLLTTALLARHPLGALYTVEPKAARRERSTAFGADRSFPPDAGDALSDALDLSHHGPQSVEGVAAEGADAIIELSGRPGVLNQALEIIGFDGRILLGSWYGTRRAPIDLGERFHRSRVSIVSSQVSTIASKYRGRWNKDRRMNTVLDLLPEMDAQTLIGEPVSIHQAPVIYDRLHQGDAQLQPIFKYT